MKIAVTLGTTAGLVVAPVITQLPAEAQSSPAIISSISPASIAAGGRITIFGAGFTSFNTVTFTGSLASASTGTAAALDSSIIAFVPLTLPTDTYQVTFTTTRSQTSNALPLAVTGTPLPSPSPTPSPTPTPGPTLTYTALGDSLAIGAIAFRGYVPRYRDHIEEDNSIAVDLDNLGRLGQTSAGLAAAVQFDPLFREAVGQADFITWNIGGNDLRSARTSYKQRTCGGELNQQCLRQTVDQFKANWTIVVREIFLLRKNNTVVIRSMDIYYPFVNEDRATDTVKGDGGTNDFDELKPYIDEVNTHIATTLRRGNIPLAKVSTVFNGPNGEIDPEDLGFISFDGFHPNDVGHRVIANLLRQLGFPIPSPTPIVLTIPTAIPTAAPSPAATTPL
jgi:lysophospholipase L1-like esterase